MSAGAAWIDAVMAPLSEAAHGATYNRIYEVVGRGSEAQGRALVAAIGELLGASRGLPAAPRLNDETLGAIEAAIIETTGDGELAAYVVRYLEAGAASRPEGDGA